MAEQDNTQEVMTLDAYLVSKGIRWDFDAIAEVARSIISGNTEAFVEVVAEKKYPTGDLAGMLREAVREDKPIRSNAIYHEEAREELDKMSRGRDFDSIALKKIKIQPSAETPAMPEPTEPEINRAWAHLIDSPNPKASALYKQDANRIRESLTAEEKRAWAREAVKRNGGKKAAAGRELAVTRQRIDQLLSPKA